MDAHEPTHFLIDHDESTSLREPFVVPLGISRGVSNEQYHGDRTAVSSTRLKGALISGQHFLAGLDDGESTEAMLFGSVLHARLLEPHCFDADYMGVPKVSARTKEGKKARSALETIAGTRRTFPLQWLDEIDVIATNIRAHKTAAALLEGAEKEVPGVNYPELLATTIVSGAVGR